MNNYYRVIFYPKPSASGENSEFYCRQRETRTDKILCVIINNTIRHL